MVTRITTPYPPDSLFFCELDAAGRVIHLGESAALHLGTAAEELVGKIWWTEVLGASAPRDPSAIHEITFVNPAKKLRRFLWLPQQAQEGSDHQLALVLDISESESLGSLPLHMSFVVEHGPSAVVITDRTGHIEYVNRKFTETTGYTREEALGLHTRILKSGETPPEEYRELWELITRGEEWHGIFHNKKKNGELFWEAASISPIRDASGRITHFLAIKENITEFREIMEALRLSETRIQSILDTAADAIITTDDTGIIQSFNRSAEKIFGYTIAEMIGKNVNLLVPSPHREKHDAYIRDFIKTGESAVIGVTREVMGVRKDSTSVPVELSVSHAVANEKHVFTAITRDVTQSKELRENLQKAREEAERANRAKSAFLANVSHEIRTPLNGIIGMLDMVRETKLTEEQAEHLSVARQSSEALLHVINDLLDFSKIEAGKMELDVQSYDLWSLLRSALRSLAVRAHEKDLELVCGVEPDVPRCLVGDSLRIRQVLTNLIGNAIKFTEKGEVSVEVSVKKSAEEPLKLCVRVADTGIGIPREKLPKIFEPFSQADVTTTRRFGGTGLGLSISAQIIQLMEGSFGVDSDIGKGTTFEFSVPQEESAEAPSEDQTMLKELLAKSTALVVDDSPAAGRVLEGILHRWGVKSTVVESKEQAVGELEKVSKSKSPYRFVLLDYRLLENDGLEIAHQIKKISHVGPPPEIIMIMSKPRLPDISAFHEIGIAAYLYKPVFQTELVEVLKRILMPEESVQELGAHPGVLSRPAPRALRVLLVEDNPINRQVAELLLQRKGHEITSAENGIEALKLIDKTTFDLVLMDIQMPELDGIETTRRIRLGKNSYKNIPIIAMTAGAMKGDQERCLGAGMNAYVSKPIRQEELFKIIDTFVPQES